MESRLYVGNLDEDVSLDALRARFAQVGRVDDVQLATDRQSGRARGHAFVTMGSNAEAQRAVNELDGATFEDRKLRVSLAGEGGARTVGKQPEAAKITSQFRERANMAYELECAGGITLTIKMFPADPREQAWRVEASPRGASELVVAASAPTRSAAVDAVAQSWAEREAEVGPSPDWGAVRRALTTVRAI